MDIVKRLRGDYGVPVPFTTTPICHEAADEIERLRQHKAELIAVVEEVVDPECGAPVGTQFWLDKVYEILDRVTGGDNEN